MSASQSKANLVNESLMHLVSSSVRPKPEMALAWGAKNIKLEKNLVQVNAYKD